MQQFLRCSPSVLGYAHRRDSFQTQKRITVSRRAERAGVPHDEPQKSEDISASEELALGHQVWRSPSHHFSHLSSHSWSTACSTCPSSAFKGKRDLCQILAGLSSHPKHFGHFAGRRSCATSSRTAGECHFAMPTSQETTKQGERDLRLIFSVSKLPEACTHLPWA